MRDHPGWFGGYDTRPVAALTERIQTVHHSIQPPDSDPMLDSDEPCPWETFLRRSGNPLIPPLGEVPDQTLSTEESAVFTAVLKPLVESGHGQDRLVVAYLTAVKG